MSKLKSVYKGEVLIVSRNFYQPRLNIEGKVIFKQSDADGRSKRHAFEITADDLLVTAQRCLQQLSAISGVEYQITYKVNGDR